MKNLDTSSGVISSFGVEVAQGNGTSWERLVVISTQIYCLLVASTYYFSNPKLFLMFPLICVALDFLSGFVHWFFDTQVKPGPTFLGRIAVNFHDHHIRPARTVDVGFIVSAYRPAVMVAIPLVTVSLLCSSMPILQSSLFWIGILGIYVPETHKITHSMNTHPALKILQRTRLILNPVAHGKHHQDNSKAYCVFTGWFNPILDKLNFWRHMERLSLVIRRDG